MCVCSATGLGQSNTMMPDAAKAKRAIKNIFTLLDKTPSIDCTKDGNGEAPAAVVGHIQFKDIVFSYPTREGRVLNHVSLDVPAGSSVALVGSSGSGKSTLVQLMQRFYDPSNPEGAVLLDGKNLKNVSVHVRTAADRCPRMVVCLGCFALRPSVLCRIASAAHPLACH